MAEQEKKDEQGAASGNEGQTGDPGRTPGKAEGEEEAVEEDLRGKEGGDQKSAP